MSDSYSICCPQLLFTVWKVWLQQDTHAKKSSCFITHNGRLTLNHMQMTPVCYMKRLHLNIFLSFVTIFIALSCRLDAHFSSRFAENRKRISKWSTLNLVLSLCPTSLWLAPMLQSHETSDVIGWLSWLADNYELTTLAPHSCMPLRTSQVAIVKLICFHLLDSFKILCWINREEWPHNVNRSLSLRLLIEPDPYSTGGLLFTSKH